MLAPVRRQDFVAQIEHLKPGERVVYHIGNLMKDRCYGPDFLAVNATAYAAWESMMAGVVHLVQRATTFGKEYIAIKRAGPHKPVKWMGCYGPTLQQSNQEKALAQGRRENEKLLGRQNGRN